MRRIAFSIGVGVIAALALLVTLIALPAAADSNFDSGAYGKCSYGGSCGSTTVVTLTPAPSSSAAPLDVDINLTNGQVIPVAGYTITVTPLNGAGTSFKNVDFYINGALVHSQTPDEQGTVSWFWDTQQTPGTDIKLVVTGLDGQTVTKEFTVKLASSGSGASTGSAAHASTPANSGGGAFSGVTSVLKQIASAPISVAQNAARATQHYIQQLPVPVKYSLPFLLFALLGLDIVLLLLRARGEAAEARRLEALFAREQQVGELKHTFSELLGHYFRTPLTVIGGSLDLVGIGAEPKPPALEAARTALKSFDAAVERLINDTMPPDEQAVPAGRVTPVWRQVGFWGPVAVVGILTVGFDYLAQHGSDFDPGQINRLVQLAVFVSFSVAAYYGWRLWQRHREQRIERSRVLEREAEFNRNRDEVIAQSGVELKQLVAALDVQLDQLGTATAKTPMADGRRRLHEVLDKLTLANLLKGSQSENPYVPADFKTMLDHVLIEQKPHIDEKKLRVTVQREVNFAVQSQELFVVVLGTILDNAVAYSGVGGAIEIDSDLTREAFTVSVTDHGVGITADKQYALFNAFSKTEGAETFNHEGMGFSLYMDKLIMNYLVGDIKVESAPQRGTRVTLTLSQPAA